MLTQPEVVPYLLQRRLIRSKSIVDGDLLVLDASQRNRNFKVISEHGPCYLLKQGVGPDGAATVAHEASVYQRLQSIAEGARLRRYLPCYYEYDPRERILILQLLSSAQDLRDYQTSRHYFSKLLAVAMGNALGTLHSLMRAQRTDDWDADEFLLRPPWILSIHRPDLGVLQEISGANIRLIKVVQSSAEFCQMLYALRERWKPEAFIHQDIRWGNCIVFARPDSTRKTRLKLIDWELAGVGDPCWDVGSVFSDYLSFWLFSIPIAGEDPPDRFMELSRWPLEKMQPAIRSFWQAYVRRMELDAPTADRLLLRAIRYGAARMVQTGFEHMQMSMQLSGNVVCLLQFSLNILRRPQEAVTHLLGIPLRGEIGQ